MKKRIAAIGGKRQLSSCLKLAAHTLQSNVLPGRRLLAIAERRAPSALLTGLGISVKAGFGPDVLQIFWTKL